MYMIAILGHVENFSDIFTHHNVSSHLLPSSSFLSYFKWAKFSKKDDVVYIYLFKPEFKEVDLGSSISTVCKMCIVIFDLIQIV